MIQALRSLRWWVEPFTLVACALLIVTTGLAHGSAGVGKSVLVLYGERGDLPAIQTIEEALLSAVAQALARSAENWQAHHVVAQIRTRIATLTSREYEVFRLVIAGLLNKQIAAELGATLRTIKTHRGASCTNWE